MVSGAGHHGRLSPTVSSRPAPEGVGQCVGEGNHRCGHGHPPGHARLEDRSEPLFRRNTVMRHQPANIRVTTPSTNGHTPPPQGPTPTTEAPPHNQCRAAPHHAHLTAHTPISVRSLLGSKSALFSPRGPLSSDVEVRPAPGLKSALIWGRGRLPFSQWSVLPTVPLWRPGGRAWPLSGVTRVLSPVILVLWGVSGVGTRSLGPSEGRPAPCGLYVCRNAAHPVSLRELGTQMRAVTLVQVRAEVSCTWRRCRVPVS